MSDDIFVVRPSVPIEYKTNVSYHDNEGFDQVDGHLKPSSNNNNNNNNNNNRNQSDSNSYNNSSGNNSLKGLYMYNGANGGSGKVKTFRKKVFCGVLIVVVIALINIVFFAVSLHKYNSLEEKMNSKYMELTETLNTVKNTTQKSSDTLQILMKDSKSLEQSVNVLNVLRKFTYVGRGWGVNKKGKLDYHNNASLSSQVDCLLFCYQFSRKDPSINAVTIVVANDYDCFCDKSSLNIIADPGMVHYVLSDPV